METRLNKINWELVTLLKEFLKDKLNLTEVHIIAIEKGTKPKLNPSIKMVSTCRIRFEQDIEGNNGKREHFEIDLIFENNIATEIFKLVDKNDAK